MRERVALLGGRFEIRSYPKNGSGNGASIGTGVGTTNGTSIGKRSVDRKRTGRGTKISIELPIAKQPPESSSVEPIAAKPMGQTVGARPTRRIRAVGA